ncbi:MAG: MoaD/ThiS family protein [Chloroflexi bacterium]|nr:MoaD/ThiS family protein [Chloroflexota bacterium]
MKIVLKSNFEVAGIFARGYIEMPGDDITLRRLLDELSGRTGGTMEIVSPRTREVNPEDFSVSLNGLEYPFLPRRLDTLLKEGDVVDVMITVLGGG